MSEIKIALIGCGQIVQGVYLNVLTRLPGCRLVAAAETDPTRRKQVRTRVPNIDVFEDWRELIARSEAEAVFVCLPTGRHAEASLAAVEAGKHVYLEKPIATNTADARRLIEARSRAGVVGMIGFNYRFNPLYLKLKDLIESGRLGRIVAVRSVFATSQTKIQDWKEKRETGGGVLLDLASHHFDLVRFLFETEISDVYARTESRESEDETAFVELTLENTVSVQSYFALRSVEEDSLEIFGTAGKASVDRYRSFDVRVTDAKLDGVHLKRLKAGLRVPANFPHVVRKLAGRGYEPSYRAAFERFLDAVRDRASVTPDFRDGLAALAAVEAAEKSAREGRRCEVKSEENGKFEYKTEARRHRA